MNGLAWFYGHSSILITGVLFVLIIASIELGFRIGRYVQHRSSSEVQSLTSSVQAGVLGLLALLLGFTFSMAMQRFDNRSQALIDEANAIGTALLRVQLLPLELQPVTVELMQQYVTKRVEVGAIDMTRREERALYDQEIRDLQEQIWKLAILAAHESPSPVTSGAYINSLNAMIDAQGKRNALLQMRVPEVVMLLLFLVFIASGAMLGYSAGLTDKRIFGPTAVMTFLIVLIVFLIIDLDRPKRGLITTDQSALIDLSTQFQSPD